MNRKSTDFKQTFSGPFLFRVVAVITIIYFVYYLWWRAASTLNPHTLFFSWLLWIAEAFGVLSYILFAWLTNDTSPTQDFKPPRPGLTVDVFIPTFNESLEILEATLTGCRKIKYPHTTYVLDDGRRDEVRSLAMRMGAEYIARQTNEHAKAGNINHALKLTHGEFIVIIDADTVPQPNYLHRTLGYFRDSKLAVIQLPQEFYNRDSIQHDQQRADWHEQALFYRVIQPGKNHTNSAFWCGSPSVVRRAALEDVGGVATETVTEDIHTSVRLHSRGWTSLYVNETLAYGIAPQTIRAFLQQRLRWAQGTMQLYRSKDSPIWKKGLSLKQRFSYLASFLAYFESFQKLILLLTPLLILIFNVFPMQINLSDFLIHWAPFFILSILANQIGGRGMFRYFSTEKFNILKMIIFIQSTFYLLSKRALKFKVTPKSEDATVYSMEKKAMWGFMSILGVLAAGMIFGLIHAVASRNGSLSVEQLLFAFFWTDYNAYIILSSVIMVLKKPHERANYRFYVDLKARLIEGSTGSPSVPVCIKDLSMAGAGLVLPEGMMRSTKDLNLGLEFPAIGKAIIPIKEVHHQRTDPTGILHAGLSFNGITGYSREHLFEYLFIHLPAVSENVLDQACGTAVRERDVQP